MDTQEQETIITEESERMRARFVLSSGAISHARSWDAGATWDAETVLAMPGPFHDASDLASGNKRAGFHYFCADSMRFFRARILGLVAGRLLVDSISGPWGEGPRSYRVSVWDDSARESERLGEFSSSAAAWRFARNVAKSCK